VANGFIFHQTPEGEEKQCLTNIQALKAQKAKRQSRLQRSTPVAANTRLAERQ
jgi:hypothetical protein